MPLSYIPKIVYNLTTISFTYPPETDDGEQTSSQVTTNVAISGVLQTIFNHHEITRAVKFSLLTEAQKNALLTFFQTWAAKGLPFNYFESDNDSAFQTYTLDPGSTPFAFTPVRQLYSVRFGGFLYSLDLNMRRAST